MSHSLAATCVYDRPRLLPPGPGSGARKVRRRIHGRPAPRYIDDPPEWRPPQWALKTQELEWWDVTAVLFHS